MHIDNTNADLMPETKTGVDPFDSDPTDEYRCAAGDLVGLNLLSEVFVRFGTTEAPDLTFTRQFIGVRRGLLRPERVILGSPAFRRTVLEEKLRGFEFEVAHIPT